MRLSLLLSITSLLAAVAAQTPDTIPSLTMNMVNAPLDSDLVDMPPPDLADEDPARDIDSSHGRPSRPNRGFPFIAWSSPGYKGHKQRVSSSSKPGCYRLDGGAVGSFEGSKDVQVGFFKDDRCRGQVLFGASESPVHRIDPIIYPRSVKLFVTEGGDGTPERPNMARYSLVTWTRPDYFGDRQLVKGFGCQPLDGSAFLSFQGEFNYKFYADKNCYGRKVLETRDGGKSTIRSISPKSVYIYE